MHGRALRQGGSGLAAAASHPDSNDDPQIEVFFNLDFFSSLSNVEELDRKAHTRGRYDDYCLFLPTELQVPFKFKGKLE